MLRKVCDVEFYKEPKTIPREALIKGIQGKDIIYCSTTDIIDSEVLDAAGQQLKVIATNSVGYDHIDINECRKRDILVSNTPGIPTDSVAELTVALMLITGRRLFEASNAIKNGEWVHMWEPYWMCGVGLKNATVGMGKIGQAVAERILSFKVNKVVYHDIHKPVDAVESMGARYVEFEDLLRDFVLCTCNLTDKTTELFTAKQFNLMKSTAIFINTSRGKVVQHDDLYDALKHGKIRAAGLDVMVPEPIPKDHRLTTLGPSTPHRNCRSNS
ncbi:glyoxylate reductase/hydroxypyruvate reductase-like isoform X1 [Tachypleus tridentatus]|uniref:glyoxylate reductase/hydroxypyruvate reductase-like isoform X1 n=1 Tax=Tachypleus tridentatus TaxID=6853 RepID=UPI003FD12772